AAANQLVERLLSFRSIEGLDGVGHQCYAPAAIQQSFGSALDTIFDEDTEDGELGVLLGEGSESLKQLIGVRIAEDVEVLLFEDDLLDLAKAHGPVRVRSVGQHPHLTGQCFQNLLLSRRALDAVGRPMAKLLVVRRMRAGRRNEKHGSFSRSVR